MNQVTGKKGERIHIALGIVLTAWILLAVYFAGTDLSISRSIADTESALGIFGRDYGQIPGIALMAACLVMFAGSHISDVNKQRLVAYASFLVGLAIVAFGLSLHEENSLTIGLSTILGLPLMVLLTRGTDWKKYRTLSKIVLILGIINPVIFVSVIKYFWGRIRFYKLSPDYSDYTPWYLPNGHSTGDYSFPSGHTANAWMLLPLLIHVKDRKWSDPVRIVTTLIVFGWGLLIPYTRILVGDHYASDVLFPTGVAFSLTLLLYKRYYRGEKKD